MAISAQRVTNIGSEVVITCEANKRLHSQESLGKLKDGTPADRETIEEAVESLLPAMIEVKESVR